MKYFDQAKPGRTIVVRLEPGELILAGIRQVIAEAGIRDGYIASGIATFDRCRLHTAVNTKLPPEFVYPEWLDTPLEVCAIQGVIADGIPHLHVVVSDADKAVAGHLEESRILFVCEIVIQELLGQTLTRQPISEQISQLVEKV
ncbi:MAG: DNA-binding protein [Negativicutes bacterium]|nr:DNA-binding protein [Negativicutes bacterium]